MGPLSGIKVIELAGIGPGPFCGMMLADMGADIIRIDRADGLGGGPVKRDAEHQVMARNRRSIMMDLKNPDAVAAILRMCESADAIVEGFRPGVMEKFGLGPDTCLKANPRLVYGRMTGWGQDGPLAKLAGHDINYAAISGILSLIGRKGQPPLAPLNVLADMGGGGLMLAFGIVCALLESKVSGKGQVVDAAMTDGSVVMASTIFGLLAAGMWKPEMGENLLDSGAHFYEVYQTACGGYMAVGSIEPQFYTLVLKGLGLEAEELPEQMDQNSWPAMKERFATIFKTKTRDEWCAIFDNTDACVTPVLTLEEAQQHPHNRFRDAYAKPNGILQASPAPRFSRTTPTLHSPPPAPGAHTHEIMADYGFSRDEIRALLNKKAIA